MFRAWVAPFGVVGHRCHLTPCDPRPEGSHGEARPAARGSCGETRRASRCQMATSTVAGPASGRQAPHANGPTRCDEEPAITARGNGLASLAWVLCGHGLRMTMCPRYLSRLQQPHRDHVYIAVAESLHCQPDHGRQPHRERARGPRSGQHHHLRRLADTGSRLWPASEKPSDPMYWMYWCREADALRAFEAEQLPGPFQAGRCCVVHERNDHHVERWLDDQQGEPGSTWDVGRLALPYATWTRPRVP